MRRLPFLAIAAFLAVPAMAAEGSSGPQEPAEIWKWLNFIILACVLGWLIAKNVGPLLANRTKEIHEGLAAGEKARVEADLRAAAVQAKLATLGTAIAEMQSASREEREREADRIRREGQTEMDRLRRQSEQEMESAAKLARIEVQRFAARLAVNLAEQKVRARMSPEVQAALVGNFTAELSDGALASDIERARTT